MGRKKLVRAIALKAAINSKWIGNGVKSLPGHLRSELVKDTSLAFHAAVIQIAKFI